MDKITRLKFKDNRIDYDLKIKDKMLLVGGDSGEGKSMLFEALQRRSIHSDPRLLCIDWRALSNLNVTNTIRNSRDKLIVIDNADKLLSLQDRLYVSMDKNNQYIIFSHSSEGYKPNGKSFVELASTGDKLEFEYILED